MSATVTFTASVELPPKLSETVNVNVCVPRPSVAWTIGVVPTTTLFESRHSNVSESPSGSLDAEPSRVTAVPVDAVHSCV